jgi:GNAT superfamily N-acetyltransferase
MRRQEACGCDSPDFEIRRLVPDDWAQLRAARLAALTDAPQAFGSTLERELGYDEQRWRRWIDGAAVFGAWHRGRLAGLAAGFADAPAQEDSAGDRTAVSMSSTGRGWHLVSMWVRPDLRGQGAADGLVEAVCRLAGDDGAARVLLWVTDVNGRARAFYERLGFASTGRRQLVRPQEPEHFEEQLARRHRVHARRGVVTPPRLPSAAGSRPARSRLPRSAALRPRAEC